MKGNFSELKDKGLDLDKILQNYMKNNDSNKDDIIEIEECKEDNNDIDDCSPMKPKQTEEDGKQSENSKLKEDQINAQNYNTFESQNKNKHINIIEKEKKQEGEVTVFAMAQFFNYGFGIFGVLIIVVL